MVNLKALIQKLNETTRAALEGAAGLCLSRTHYDVEVEHYLLKLLDTTDTDLPRNLKAFGIDKSRLTNELMRSLDKLKSGNARTPAFSPTLLKMFTEAWTLGSINFGADEVRSGFAVLALVSDAELARLVREVSREFQKIDPEALKKDFFAIMAGSKEEPLSRPGEGMEAAGAPGEPGAVPRASKQPNLDQY